VERCNVLVTGGSRGIGRAIVERLAADGWTVAFTWASDEARAAEVARACGARAFPLDLRDRKRPDALVREIEEALGPLAALVNNAGTRRDGLLAMTSDADWDEVLEVDLGGVFRCCRAVLPGMVSRRKGAIVSIASLSALQGVAGQSAYSAAKAGVLALTRSLAREVGKRGIRVNAVVPGFVATDLTAELPAAAVAALRSHECLGEGVRASSVAGAVAFLLSDEAASVTGREIVVDAGAGA
jgi:3-oxoacyl-[acyl-carrier protein] reductase